MEGTIINNARTNVQVYTERTSDPSGKDQPSLRKLPQGQVPVVGAGSSADVYLYTEGDYIYCGLWKAEASFGPPDSWVIFSTADAKVVKFYFNQYDMSVTKDTDGGFTITVTDGSGNTSSGAQHQSPPTVNSTGGSGWLVILIVMLLLLVVGIGIGVFFLLNIPAPVPNPFVE